MCMVDEASAGVREKPAPMGKKAGLADQNNTACLVDGFAFPFDQGLGSLSALNSI